jgi:hypothetical protein
MHACFSILFLLFPPMIVDAFNGSSESRLRLAEVIRFHSIHFNLPRGVSFFVDVGKYANVEAFLLVELRGLASFIGGEQCHVLFLAQY